MPVSEWYDSDDGTSWSHMDSDNSWTGNERWYPENGCWIIDDDEMKRLYPEIWELHYGGSDD